MAIPYKDLFHDAQAVRANRKDLLEQAFEKQQTVLSDKQQQKETEIDLISQIKATLREAQTQKQHLLYKQRRALSNSLQTQLKEQRTIQQAEASALKEPLDFFPFNYQDTIIAKQTLLQSQRRKEMQEQLQRQKLFEQQRLVQRPAKQEPLLPASPLATPRIADGAMQEAVQRQLMQEQKRDQERLQQREQLYSHILQLELNNERREQVRRQQAQNHRETLE